jgi:hypothetical protein
MNYVVMFATYLQSFQRLCIHMVEEYDLLEFSLPLRYPLLRLYNLIYMYIYRLVYTVMPYHQIEALRVDCRWYAE